METSFTNEFADFLEERLGTVLFNLRKRNNDYQDLSDEYTALLMSQYNSIDEYRKAISRIADIIQKLNDIEKHYLFLAGMREHTFMEDTLKSNDFENVFIN